MNASVSVIVPCFRSADTIGRALQSIDEQTIRPREVILVDDASGDETLGVLLKKKSEYEPEWIKVLVLATNSGPAAARNLGWENASSDFIAFLDSDDAWHSKKIQIQYGWMANHPQAVLTGHACRVIRVREDLPLLPERWTVQEINRRKILFSNPFPTSSIMLRRDIPFRFLNTQRSSEDYMLWLQIVFNGSPSYLLDLPLAFLFKKRYGVRGLSADMKKMEDGELFNYRRLYEMGMISFGRYCCIVQYSRIKYLIRCGITRIRSGRNLH